VDGKVSSTVFHAINTTDYSQCCVPVAVSQFMSLFHLSPSPGRVVPLSQIHSLRPSLQPRAWLDVMASAHTTRDDKNEAMQEILILAKDKVSVRVLAMYSRIVYRFRLRKRQTISSWILLCQHHPVIGDLSLVS
jgi:hypothetical protein